MRTRFDEQLDELDRELKEMGDACVKAIGVVQKALDDGNCELARDVAPLRDDIDRRERDIEAMCLRILLQQHPVARDLRHVSAALKMITDMMRIGVQASEISEIIGYLDGRCGKDCDNVCRMADEAMKMVTDSVGSFMTRDLDAAYDVINRDDIVDGLFVTARKNLIAYIGKRPEDGEYALDLLMIAKYFERIADHAVNIAGWVAFSMTGVHSPDNN